MSNPPHDGQLLKRYVGEHDQAAFAEIATRHAAMVFRFCQRFCRDDHEAEDATQQVFTTLVLKAPMLVERSSLVGWLRRTAWQISCRNLRASTIRRKHEALAAEAIDASSDGVLEPDVVQLVHAQLANLPEPYREAIQLYYFSAMTVAEVARHTHCPIGTAAARISRGRDMLREQIGPAVWCAIGACIAAESLQCETASSAPLAAGGAPAALTTSSNVGWLITPSLVKKTAAAILVFSYATAAAGTGRAVPFLSPAKTPGADDSHSSGNWPISSWLHSSNQTDSQDSARQNSSSAHERSSPVTMVPEPSSTMALGAFAAGVLLQRRRRSTLSRTSGQIGED